MKNEEAVKFARENFGTDAIPAQFREALEDGIRNGGKRKSHKRQSPPTAPVVEPVVETPKAEEPKADEPPKKPPVLKTLAQLCREREDAIISRPKYRVVK